jgi:magnesium-transporting ATPase (P-type)
MNLLDKILRIAIVLNFVSWAGWVISLIYFVAKTGSSKIPTWGLLWMAVLFASLILFVMALERKAIVNFINGK